MCKRASEIYLKEEPCPLNKYFEVKTDFKKVKTKTIMTRLQRRLKEAFKTDLKSLGPADKSAVNPVSYQ